MAFGGARPDFLDAETPTTVSYKAKTNRSGPR